ncbi:hypothetical protein Dimus_016999 [Dionaea muscipula]
MYADRVELEKRSIKERLNGSFIGDSDRRRTLTGKRQRQDDKWEHDLYKDDETPVSRSRLDARDLRLKLQRKNVPLKGGVRDLREKLSGSMYSQPVNADSPAPAAAPKLKPEPEASKAARKSIIPEPSAAECRKVADSAAKKKTQQKVDGSVDGFLQSLGLEKYLITFQAEEVSQVFHVS